MKEGQMSIFEFDDVYNFKKGKEYKKNPYTISTAREYTPEEIELIKELDAKGVSNKRIAEITGKTETGIRIKIIKMKKNNNNYNKLHYKEKYETNQLFLNLIKPETVLDLYCGEKNYYNQYKTTTNDKNKKIKATYNDDALRTACRLYAEGNKYDLVDLDPFGSAYDCYDLAIKMAKKGIIITIGELGHKRFKRLDFVKSHYGINTMEEFTIERIINEIKKIGINNHKNLIPIFIKEWNGRIGRVYFKIEEIKITEQWEKIGE